LLKIPIFFVSFFPLSAVREPLPLLVFVLNVLCFFAVFFFPFSYMFFL